MLLEWLCEDNSKLVNINALFRLCFTKLKLLLIAIEVKSLDGCTNIAINPGPDAKVEAGTQGFFIAQSDDEAKR